MSEFVKWPHSRSPRAGWIVDERGCHIWQGSRGRYGYGYGRDPRTGKTRMMHRVRYEIEVGPVPTGMQLDHFACDNPSCCNPAHVRPVTPRENTLRGNTLTSRNLATTHCPAGHPLSGDNLVPSSLRAGWRKCRACDLEQKKLKPQCGKWRNNHRCSLLAGHEGPHRAGKDGETWGVSPPRNQDKTHCPRGHLYSDNLTSRKGWRECRACRREKDRESRRRGVNHESQ